MNIISQGQLLCGNSVSIEAQGDDYTIYRFSDENGDMVISCHSVFPGIHLVYKDVHLPRCSVDIQYQVDDIIEIEHCREGRVECQDKDEYFYLTADDISLRRKSTPGRELVFPMSHYHGISIIIDLKKTPKCLTCLMDDVNVKPAALIEKFRLDEKSSFTLRQLPSIKHIFSELYTVPEAIKKGYFKVKILEILLFLSGVEPDKDELLQRRFSPSQVELAKNACQYVTEHMQEHITIAELAKQFSTSPTQLKDSFRGVYGASIQAFIRNQKMHSAALLLRNTDRTVLDISTEFGYSNASKFANAFQSVMGVTPTQYRLQQ